MVSARDSSIVCSERVVVCLSLCYVLPSGGGGLSFDSFAPFPLYGEEYRVLCPPFGHCRIPLCFSICVVHCCPLSSCFLSLSHATTCGAGPQRKTVGEALEHSVGKVAQRAAALWGAGHERAVRSCSSEETWSSIIKREYRVYARGRVQLVRARTTAHSRE